MDLTSLSLNPMSLLVLLPVLNGLGRTLKSTPRVSNHIIPWIVSAAGGAGYAGLEGVSTESVLIGIGLGQVAVGLHQTVTQSGQFVASRKDRNDPPESPDSGRGS